jgi:hypothetical protein
MTTTIEQLRRQLLTNEVAEKLNAPVVFDDEPETIAPANWIVTVEDANGGCSVALVAISGYFSDLATEKGGVRGHGFDPLTEMCVYFAADGDADAMTEYVKAHQQYRKEQGKKRGKGFA